MRGEKNFAIAAHSHCMTQLGCTHRPVGGMDWNRLVKLVPKFHQPELNDAEAK
jgi:hypothetical protein